MQAAALIGYKDSGKTTLALELCKRFKELGLKIAVAKFSHHRLALEGTDTEVLSDYADSVLGLSEDRTQLIWNSKKYLPDLTGLLQADVLLVEGGKSLAYLPKIILADTRQAIQELDSGMTLGVWSEHDVPGYTVVREINDLARMIMEKGFMLPGLDCSACGRNDCAELAREIVRGEASARECQARYSSLQVTINGTQLPLNPFVNAILANGIKGMLSSLKGYQPGQINISLEA
ncbi:MAG: molybdopterin-guanine dinucleotide biosynthesis protein MobB [Desulfohalobiaceae bacterium]|nr:molybdopterin-guanine dinucleotide biosynthesis protein MobB [Desulfohalobiaceae bacterium]